MKPEEWKWRYLILVFNCWITFGCFYNVDILGPLQADIQGRQISCANLTTNGTCCEECLGLGPFRYNQLFTAFAWMNALSSLPGGIIVDRLGNRVAAILFTAITSSGAILFALATLPDIRRTDAMLPLMFCGRLLLGSGIGTSLIIQQRVVYFWFKDKISMSLGFVNLVLRLATVSNFLLTANVQKWMGINFALWIGAFACLISFTSAICLFLLDFTGTKKLDSESKSRVKPVPFRIRDICSFPAIYWLLCFTDITHHSSFLPFVPNGSKYIQDRYGYSKTTASYFVGAVADTGLVVSPIMGFVSAKVNMNGLFLLMTLLLMIPIYPLLSYCPAVHPLILIIWLGFCSSAGAIFLWSSLIRVVPFKNYGFAGGIASCLNGLTVGITLLVTGKILGSEEAEDSETRIARSQRMLLLLLSISVAALIFIIIVNIVDLTGKRAINDRLAKNKVNTREKSEISSDSLNVSKPDVLSTNL